MVSNSNPGEDDSMGSDRHIILDDDGKLLISSESLVIISILIDPRPDVIDKKRTRSEENPIPDTETSPGGESSREDTLVTIGRTVQHHEWRDSTVLSESSSSGDRGELPDVGTFSDLDIWIHVGFRMNQF